MGIPILEFHWEVYPQISAYVLDINHSHLQVISPCCGLSRNVIALILADPNVAMLEEGQTNNSWVASRMINERSEVGETPFEYRQH